MINATRTAIPRLTDPERYDKRFDSDRVKRVRLMIMGRFQY
jgi:hypothetical protein